MNWRGTGCRPGHGAVTPRRSSARPRAWPPDAVTPRLGPEQPRQGRQFTSSLWALSVVGPASSVRRGSYDRWMSAVEDARHRLAAEEGEAWRDYLATIRGRAGQEYVEIESWAWSRLSQRLRSIRARRGWLRRAAA